MDRIDALRAHVMKPLDWQDAHLNFDAAVEGVPPELRGVRPGGMPYSLWQLLEHMRIAQLDILEFCRNPDYREPKMEDYWPKTASPPTAEAWDESIASFRKDLYALKQLASNPELDLFAKIPHGAGQTYLRELLLVADHNAYHLGQFMAVRRLLGIWQ
ncbi:MAG TPA: DinB family protein [Blastocatellia bacterium]|nr:DinB family protein [Blastocatellia bacterium]